VRATRLRPGQEEAEPLREVVYEETRPTYVFWEDYREGPARKWAEVPWIRYKSYLDRDALIKRFGKKKGGSRQSRLHAEGRAGDDKGGAPPDMLKKAVVHEYWDKEKQQVVWLAPGTPDLILDKQDDPLQLQGFYPSPNPALATTTNDKRIPVPDFIEYQDQAKELDNLTARIDTLVKACKVVGFYPGENKQVLQQVFDDGMENKMIPIEDWQFFTDGKPGGGITVGADRAGRRRSGSALQRPRPGQGGTVRDHRHRRHHARHDEPGRDAGRAGAEGQLLDPSHHAAAEGDCAVCPRHVPADGRRGRHALLRQDHFGDHGLSAAEAGPAVAAAASAAGPAADVAASWRHAAAAGADAAGRADGTARRTSAALAGDAGLPAGHAGMATAGASRARSCRRTRRSRRSSTPRWR
jgi:hypothetical protein